jgi:hypothetical protein
MKTRRSKSTKSKTQSRKPRTPQQERLRHLREDTSPSATAQRAAERTATETARLMGKAAK